jgi:tetratricopeptide (TPR) repeat protein
MKLIQKLLSHGLLIAFFAAVFFIYLYRVQLFPQWFGEQEQTVAMQSESEAQQEAADVAATEPAPVEAQPAAAAGAAPAVPATAELPPVAGEPVAPAPASPWAAQSSGPGGMPAPPPAAVDRQPQQQVAQAPAQSQPVPQYRPPAQPKTYVPRETQAIAPPPVHQPRIGGQAAQTTSSQAREESDYQQKLTAARELYWQRDMQGAIEAYKGLTGTYPDQADAWGELGNLNFKLGRWSDASDAYSRAIGLLIDQGDTSRATHLLRVMYGLDAEKAGELEARLRQAGG